MMGFWDGSGISWTICKPSAPRSRQITTPTPHHCITPEKEKPNVGAVEVPVLTAARTGLTFGGCLNGVSPKLNFISAFCAVNSISRRIIINSIN